MIDCRHTTRYTFGAIAEVIDLGSRSELIAITRDVSFSGCFVKTTTPFPEGTEVRVRIISLGTDFAAIGRVTANVTPVGMGIEFVEIALNDQAVIQKWLGYPGTNDPLRESSSLKPVRDERLIHGIPVTVSGETSAGIFTEETETKLVTPKGALLTLAASVSPGQIVRLKNRLTRMEQKCRVLFVDPTPGDKPKLLGVEFLKSEARQ